MQKVEAPKAMTENEVRENMRKICLMIIKIKHPIVSVPGLPSSPY